MRLFRRVPSGASCAASSARMRTATGGLPGGLNGRMAGGDERPASSPRAGRNGVFARSDGAKESPRGERAGRSGCSKRSGRTARSKGPERSGRSACGYPPPDLAGRGGRLSRFGALRSASGLKRAGRSIRWVGAGQPPSGSGDGLARRSSARARCSRNCFWSALRPRGLRSVMPPIVKLSGQLPVPTCAGRRKINCGHRFAHVATPCFIAPQCALDRSTQKGKVLHRVTQPHTETTQVVP